MVAMGAQLLLADLNGDGAKALAAELWAGSYPGGCEPEQTDPAHADLAYQRWGRHHRGHIPPPRRERVMNRAVSIARLHSIPPARVGS